MTLPSLGETGITFLMIAAIFGVCALMAWLGEIGDRREQRRLRDVSREAAREEWRREHGLDNV